MSESVSAYSLFKVSYQSSLVDKPENAKITCLHDLPGMIGKDLKLKNANLIDEIKRSNPESKVVVLVENVKSFVAVHQKQHQQTFYCHEELEVIGWDLGAAYEYVDLSEENRELFKNCMSHFDEDHLALLDIDLDNPKETLKSNEWTERQAQGQKHLTLCLEKNIINLAEKDCKAKTSMRLEKMIETIQTALKAYDKIIIITNCPFPVIHIDPMTSIRSGTGYEFLRQQSTVQLNHNGVKLYGV